MKRFCFKCGKKIKGRNLTRFCENCLIGEYQDNIKLKKSMAEEKHSPPQEPEWEADEDTKIEE